MSIIYDNNYTKHGYFKHFVGICTLVFGMAFLGCLHMSTLEPSDSHTLTTLLVQYVIVLSPKFLSAKFYHHFLLKLKKCRLIQDELLLWWLQENSQTEYGKRYDFSSIKSREDYVARHPLTTFTHYEHYMERTVNGENNILTKRDVVYLCLSSRTTGKNTLYPKTKSHDNIFCFIFSCKTRHA